MVTLLHKYPAAVAWVSGHSHVNSVEAYKDPAGNGGFWSIRTAALADWPKQNRLVEIFDNKDGNLSIFGTLIDQASPVPAPAAGTPRRRYDARPARFARTHHRLQRQPERWRALRRRGLWRRHGHRPQRRAPDQGSAQAEVGPADRRPKISKVKITPKKKKLKAGKKTKLTVAVTNSGNAAKKNAKLYVKSSNKRVKVRKKINIKSIGRRQDREGQDHGQGEGQGQGQGEDHRQRLRQEGHGQP